MLGLGDSNYDQFCNCGKTIDARLDAIGAIRFVPSAFADEATGLEKTVEPYVRLVVEACRALLNNEGVAISPPAAQLAPHDTIVPPSTEPSPKSKAKLLLAKRRANAQPELVLSWADDSTDYLKEGSLWRWRVDETELLLRGYTPESPFWSEICHAEYLTAPSSKKTVMIFIFQRACSYISYARFSIVSFRSLTNIAGSPTIQGMFLVSTVPIRRRSLVCSCVIRHI